MSLPMSLLASPIRTAHLRRACRPAALATVLALLTVLAAWPAAAQPDFLVGVRAGTADLSGGLFEDAYDGSVTPLGLQAEARWPSFSLRLAAEQADADGELFIPDTVGGNVLPGSEVELNLDLYHLTAAYHRESAGGGWGWFAGGGLSFANAEEETFFDSRDSDATGFHAAAGVRVSLGTRFELGGEILYMSLTDLVAAIDGEEEDLDGVAAAASLAFRF